MIDELADDDLLIRAYLMSSISPCQFAREDLLRLARLARLKASPLAKQIAAHPPGAMVVDSKSVRMMVELARRQDGAALDGLPTLT